MSIVSISNPIGIYSGNPGIPGVISQPRDWAWLSGLAKHPRLGVPNFEPRQHGGEEKWVPQCLPLLFGKLGLLRNQ